MTKWLARWGAILAASAAVGCDGGVDRTSGQVVLSGDDWFPCILDFEHTGVTLRSDVAGSVPDPVGPVALARDGGFYTSTPPGSGQIAVWSDTGEFVRMIGRFGKGPGEFGMGPYAKVDDTGTLHVFSMGDTRWQRFTPDGELISVARPRSAAFGIGWHHLFALSPDSVLSAFATDGRQFRIFDAAGTPESAFGAPGEGRGDRPIASIESGAFWAAPSPGDGRGYVLEEWAVDGSLLRRVTRDVPWWPSPAEFAESASDGWTYPTFQLYPGAHDHLVVVVWLRRPAPGSNGEAWFEVLDPETPEVLASTKFEPRELGVPGAHPIWNIFPGTQRGIFERSEEETGLPIIDIMRYRLEPNPEVGRDGGCGGGA